MIDGPSATNNSAALGSQPINSIIDCYYDDEYNKNGYILYISMPTRQVRGPQVIIAFILEHCLAFTRL